MRVVSAALLARAIGLGALVCVLGAGAMAVPAPAVVPARAVAPVDGANLLLNPGADIGDCSASGYDAMTMPGWTVTAGSPDAICNGTAGFLPADPARGRAYFAGGATGDARMIQRVDVSSASAAIDRGGARFDLSGALGGWSAQNDRVRLTATFIDAGGTPLDQVSLPIVTNTDRGLASGLLTRHQTGPVPPDTREIDVSAEFLWTAGDTTDGYADDLALRLSVPVDPPVLRRPNSNVPQFDHVFVVFMENENYADSEAPSGSGDYIVGNPAAPYLNKQVAKQASLLGRMFATTHPSDPNYLAVTGGATFGYTRNLRVGTDRIAAAHIGDRLDAAGKTWAAYAGGMAYPCDMTTHDTESGGYYLPNNEPFMMYADVIAKPFECAAHNKPIEQLSVDLRRTGTTPDLVWLAADDGQSMERGGVSAGDTWLSHTLPVIFRSPAWTTQRSLLIVSWDEGRREAFGPDYPNHVATYVLGSQGTVKSGYVSPLRYTGYSLGATICDALRVPTMTSNDTYAQRLSDVWRQSSGGAPSAGI